MPVPNQTPAQVFNALEKAEQELKTATASLNLLSQQLSSVRSLVQHGESDIAKALQVEECSSQPEMPKTISKQISKQSSLTKLPSKQFSVTEVPPGLVLHRQHKLQKSAEAEQQQCLRRMDTLGTSGGSGQELCLQGRWMELSRQACQDATGIRDMAIQALASNRSRSRKVEDDIWSTPAGVFHPRGTFKLAWDLIALLLLLNDCLLLPVAIAWDFSMTTVSSGGLYVAISFYISLLFWTIDFPLNFNTAIYVRGSLVMNRRTIFRHYAWTWMIFDISLLLLDYCFLFLSSDLIGLRAARILRMVRLVRISKLSKLNTMIEESAASVGREWITMVFAIGKTGIMMLMVAHFLTCAWFFVGIQFGPEFPEQSWVELAHIAKRPGTDDPIPPGEEVAQVQHLVPNAVQYMQALRWVMGPPSPPVLSPASGAEWGFDIFITVITLLVIGSAISKISGTTAELRAMREESNRRRRNVRLYLARTSVSYELVTRIMRFVDYKLEKFPSNTLDSSLVSPALQLELFVSQHADYLSRMPIFALAQECYPDVFSNLCAAMTKNFFEKGDTVFVAGAFATYLHVTATGTYDYADRLGKTASLKGTYWFGELSLFAEWSIHQSTLTATSFAETFVLKGEDVVECIKSSRGCTSMFCEYAKDFVAAMQKTSSKHDDEDQVQQGEVCCKQNQHFRAMYPDLKKKFENIIVYGEDADAVIQADSHTETDSEVVTRKSSLASKTLCRLNSDCSTAWTAGSSTSSGIRRDCMQDPGLLGFVMTSTSDSLVADMLPGQLEEYIPELHPDFSPHVIFEQAAERDRALSSCISVLALVNNRYDIFTAPQGKNVKLKPSQWEELQELVAWIDPSPQEVQAVLVLLAIRALGKSKLVQEQLPAKSQRPERAVVYLVQSVQNIVPSVRWLTARSIGWVEEALLTHELFNLAQLLQGENCPASVKQLRDSIELKGDAVFRFYILFLLGFMSGLAAGHGSRFMDAKNSETTIAGIRMLEHLMKVDPVNLYWGYMGIRAEKLQLPFNSPEDMVLLRLACLQRLKDNSQYKSLKNAWLGLGVRERDSLTEHFLADGIEEPAWVLEFLPNCVASAQANPVVGLTGLLDVLAELLSNLRSRRRADDPQMMLVDLSDMSGFIAAVKNRFVFLTCVARAQLRFENSRVRVEMSGGNWGRITEPDSDLTNIAYTLQDLVQKQQVVEERVLRSSSK